MNIYEKKVVHKGHRFKWHCSLDLDVFKVENIISIDCCRMKWKNTIYSQLYCTLCIILNNMTQISSHLDPIQCSRFKALRLWALTFTHDESNSIYTFLHLDDALSWQLNIRFMPFELRFKIQFRSNLFALLFSLSYEAQMNRVDTYLHTKASP